MFLDSCPFLLGCQICWHIIVHRILLWFFYVSAVTVEISTSFLCLFGFSLSLSIYIFFFFGLFAISRAAPMAYGGSQARGQIGAVAAGLRQSHSNAGSESHLRPTPQLTAMPNP